MRRGSAQFASGFLRDMNAKRLNFPNGGLHFPRTTGCLIQFEPPSTFVACRGVALGDALVRVRRTRSRLR